MNLVPLLEPRKSSKTKWTRKKEQTETHTQIPPNLFRVCD